MIEHKLLAIYLNDHYAASLAGHDVAVRSASSNDGNEFGGYLSELVAEIEDERSELERIMESLEVGIDRLKVSAAWTAEKVGRLKLNGRLREYSPLSRVVELEALSAGINAKLGMWRALELWRSKGEPIPSVDLTRLMHQAEEQRTRVEELRLKAIELL
jgi:hypothetical protein